uniref:SCP domain-containing protein n=1 Tax=Mesocestoides corti TaxID=53468 RepID=A0A5K3G291_MESCO
MDQHRANLSLQELATVALRIRQQSEAPLYASARRSSCYLDRRFMYWHGAYQVRGLGPIADLRSHFVVADSADGCEDMGLRGLTGDLRTCSESHKPGSDGCGHREVAELVLWSTSESVGLQPVARVGCC